MPVDPEYLMALDRASIEQNYNWRDAAIYALGLGYGCDPTDKGQLQFLDTGQAMQAHPAIANVLAYDGDWLRDPATGIDYLHVVHGEQEMEIHRPFPISGKVTAQTRIEEIVDKGEGKGALITSRREIYSKETGTRHATVRHTAFCRGAGGFGGKSEQSRPPHPTPERAPDGSISISTPPQLALIYRLSGDLNALHADPQVAQKAGFDRPILHGLSTFGIACRALMAGVVDTDPQRVYGLSGRFSSPVYPGDEITVDWWVDAPGRAAFTARVNDRTVLKNGRFDYREVGVS